jgi:hypothetical protein
MTNLLAPAEEDVRQSIGSEKIKGVVARFMAEEFMAQVLPKLKMHSVRRILGCTDVFLNTKRTAAAVGIDPERRPG